MKCAHGQLGAGFPDGLSCQNPNSLPDFYGSSVRQIAAVAFAAHTSLGLAGQNRANLDIGDAGFFYGFDRGFINIISIFGDNFVSIRIMNIFQQGSP